MVLHLYTPPDQLFPHDPTNGDEQAVFILDLVVMRISWDGLQGISPCDIRHVVIQHVAKPWPVSRRLTTLSPVVGGLHSSPFDEQRSTKNQGPSGLDPGFYATKNSNQMVRFEYS